MHGWGRQGCWLAHHTGYGKCTAWCSKHSFLSAKCGLACLYHIQKPAGLCPGSRQGSRLTQSTPGKREGSNHLSRGVHRAEKGSASQDKWNHSIYNWRRLSSDLGWPGLVTELCDSRSPGPGLRQQLAEKAGWGTRSTTAPLWDPHRVALAELWDTFFKMCYAEVNCAHTKFQQLSSWLGSWGQQAWEKSCLLAEPLGLPGMLGGWEMRDRDVNHICTTLVIMIYHKPSLAALFAWRWQLSPPPQYFQTVSCLLFVCTEVMMNFN